MKGLPALLGALGAVFVGFGLIYVFVVLLDPFRSASDRLWILGNLSVGLVLVGIALALSFETLRERLGSGEGRRIGRYGSSAVAQTVISLAIVGLLAFMANRYHWRFDWSEAGVHSLSDQTRNELERLERDVDVVAFYGSLDQPRARDLLDRYAYASERFHVQYVDPNRRPDLVEGLGIAQEKLANGLVHLSIGDESLEIQELSEERITNAMVQITRQGEKKVYFLTGHNERPIEGKGADDSEAFARAADDLRNENYSVATLLLSTLGDVPDDADVVVIAGPTRPLRPEEQSALERYIGRGGAVLAMLDPRANTNLGELLAGWGVEAGDDAIIDRVQGLFGQAMSPLAGEYGNHEITRDMREVTLFPVTRSVQARPGGGGRFTPIVKTGPDSWAERNLALLFSEGQAELGDDDLPGPVTIAVAGRPAQPTPPGGGDEAGEGTAPGPSEARLVVFGDSDFASNRGIDASANRDLFLNSVNWLIGDIESISIRPPRSRASRVQLSTEQIRTVRNLSIFVLPQVIAVLGVWAWWSRRRAPGR